MKLKGIASSVLAASVLMGAASSSFADAIATAYLEISSFKFTKTVDGSEVKLRVGTDLNFNSGVQNDGDTAASLNGVSDNESAAAPASDGALDIPHVCIGACTYVENSFSKITKPSLTDSTYALGDAILSGASVNFPAGTPGLPPSGDLPDVTARTLAEVALDTGNAIGSANGNNLGVQTSITFEAGFTGTMNFSYAVDAYLRAVLSADAPGVQANGDIQFKVSLLDSTTGDDQVHAPNAINKSRSATVPGNDFEYALNAGTGGNTFSDSFTVVAGRQYQLTIDHSSDANAQVIPEPASLAILGAGLLGMGVVRRQQRRRKS